MIPIKLRYPVFIYAISIFLIGCAVNLNDAIQEGRVGDVKNVINKDRTKVYEKDKWGYTLLHDAVVTERLEIVEYLLQQGADVNTKNLKRSTPLHDAAFKGRVELVRFLLAKGADANAQDISNNTPLHEAVAAYGVYITNFRYIEVVKLLLSFGAVVNNKNNKGETPLHLASKTHNFEIVKLLASKGADVNNQDNAGNTPLHETAKTGELKIQLYLLSRGAQIKTKNKEDQTPADIAAQNNHAEMLKLLYAKGADVPATDDTSNKVVKYATKPSKQKEMTLSRYSVADFGRYYALIIGNNNYHHLPQLKTARHDATRVADILQNHYGFSVNLLVDAKRSEILLSLNNFRKKLHKDDNLLIYYAGHGWLDEEADEGYWLPTDADSDNDVHWISNSSITSKLKAINAKHILVVTDSCYSGKLSRGLHISHRNPNYFYRISRKKARSVLSSGGLEPVIDSGGSNNHSVFASALLNALMENEGIMDATMLFLKIRRPVMLNSDQTPEYSDIRKAGHQGGDFLFVRHK